MAALQRVKCYASLTFSERWDVGASMVRLPLWRLRFLAHVVTKMVLLPLGHPTMLPLVYIHLNVSQDSLNGRLASKYALYISQVLDTEGLAGLSFGYFGSMRRYAGIEGGRCLDSIFALWSIAER
ncbi:hypothetical protein DQ04_03741030 [Trypanosoma grayi]|uniref:hypothetical protein n=1 Tax=Trypanosoma grayi TaxID=71804 RepID=UPI0004F42ADF|nr:hypothetical protein DQ04_03741030 [Trypanosoma grayi]KEG10410.1 hypothetical protein DQ04_03741030 [Trypanosoma grayi]